MKTTKLSLLLVASMALTMAGCSDDHHDHDNDRQSQQYRNNDPYNQNQQHRDNDHYNQQHRDND